MEKNNPFQYSVLMSVYYKDNPEWLKIAIDSMLNQTVKTNDFVIVEDGVLTEELENVIKQYEEKNKDIFNIVRIKENGGLGPALALGVENCKNELIARMDADDYSVPDRCEKQLKLIKGNPKIDIIGSNHIEFIGDLSNKESYLYKNLPSTNEEIIKYSRRRNPFSHSVVMFRKNKVLEVGNYRTYYYLEDYDLWSRMIMNNCYCENINEYLSYVRVSKDLYKRRGGIKYLKSILKFKKELYGQGLYSFNDLIISSSAHLVVCLLPGKIRKFIYNKFLRKQ